LSSYGERLGQNATFKGEGFKEATPNGNQEKGSEEEGRKEKETLTNPGEAEASLVFAHKTGLRDFVPGAFCWPVESGKQFAVVRTAASC
jgi:hypothetical protein